MLMLTGICFWGSVTKKSLGFFPPSNILCLCDSHTAILHGGEGSGGGESIQPHTKAEPVVTLRGFGMSYRVCLPISFFPIMLFLVG